MPQEVIVISSGSESGDTDRSSTPDTDSEEVSEDESHPVEELIPHRQWLTGRAPKPRVRIPQNPPPPPSAEEEQRPIYFMYQGRPGINVKTLLQGEAFMDGADHRLFAGIICKRFQFGVFWPGYPSATTFLPTRRADGRLLTRMEHAINVAQFISDYFEDAATQPVDDRYQDYAIGPSDFHLSDVFITCLEFRDRGLWYAPMEVPIY